MSNTFSGEGKKFCAHVAAALLNTLGAAGDETSLLLSAYCTKLVGLSTATLSLCQDGICG